MATQEDVIDKLDLGVIAYDEFMQNEPRALSVLHRALHEQGIVGLKGIPGFADGASVFIEQSRQFNALPENVKERYAPKYGAGKERFMRPDGTWIVDDLKVSYYGFVPDTATNKWPIEVDLKTSFQALGALMSEMGTAVMQKISLLGSSTGIYIDGIPRMGRMLYYRKMSESHSESSLWCGSHFDHGMFTALLPAVYFANGKQIPEPEEAGLYIKTRRDGIFKKILVNDPNVLLFQVGEFGQLATNDGIKATEHCVHKAKGAIERFTMALFFDAPMDHVIHSYSELTQDARYGGDPGDPCSYRHWHEASLQRYLVKK